MVIQSKSVKIVIFANVRLPIRADVFLKQHINSIDGLAKHMLTKQIGEIVVAKELAKRREDEEEDWGGQATKAKRKQKKTLISHAH